MIHAAMFDWRCTLVIDPDRLVVGRRAGERLGRASPAGSSPRSAGASMTRPPTLGWPPGSSPPIARPPRTAPFWWVVRARAMGGNSHAPYNGWSCETESAPFCPDVAPVLRSPLARPVSGLRSSSDIRFPAPTSTAPPTSTRSSMPYVLSFERSAEPDPFIFHLALDALGPTRRDRPGSGRPRPGRRRGRRGRPHSSAPSPTPPASPGSPRPYAHRLRTDPGRQRPAGPGVGRRGSSPGQDAEPAGLDEVAARRVPVGFDDGVDEGGHGQLGGQGSELGSAIGGSF